MSLEIEKRDRHSPQSDTRSGSLATSPMRISGTLPDGTQIGPFELKADETLTLIVEELEGARAETEAALARAAAIAEGDQAATVDAFRRANRLAAHLQGPKHGLRAEEIPQDAERLHSILHPDGMRDHEAI